MPYLNSRRTYCPPHPPSSSSSPTDGPHLVLSLNPAAGSSLTRTDRPHLHTWLYMSMLMIAMPGQKAFIFSLNADLPEPEGPASPTIVTPRLRARSIWRGACNSQAGGEEVKRCVSG
eukprot:365105-Chlamydomonas_euryale.AAC.12